MHQRRSPTCEDMAGWLLRTSGGDAWQCGVEIQVLDLRLDCVETECRKESSEIRIGLGTQLGLPDYLYFMWIVDNVEVW